MEKSIFSGFLFDEISPDIITAFLQKAPLGMILGGPVYWFQTDRFNPYWTGVGVQYFRWMSVPDPNVEDVMTSRLS